MKPSTDRLRLEREPMTPRCAAAAFLAVALDAIGRYHHTKGLQAVQASPSTPQEDRRYG